MEKLLKRMNYFDGLYLKADDYRQDKDYQRRLQGFHNRYLHTWGIAGGLEVKSVADGSMEVYVTEGAALDSTDEGYGTDINEVTSRQILIYEGHPDNPLDLSEYPAGENIYIWVSYLETSADRSNEKGQGEEIHVWERGCLSHGSTKPDNTRKNILLARVVPRTVQMEVKNSDGTSTFYDETVIDTTCIYDTDTDGSSLRVYAGPYARVLQLERFIFRFGEEITDMPYLTKIYDEGKKELELLVNSMAVRFTGDVEVSNDLTFKGQLVSKRRDGTVDPEFKTVENILQLNSRDDDEDAELWKTRDGGLEVYRGGTDNAPDARIVWSEADRVWKAGLGNDLSTIAHGPVWEALRNQSYADEQHKHGRLSSAKGTVLETNGTGDISVNSDLRMEKNGKLWLSGAAELAWYSDPPDGPVLSGKKGGLLGTFMDSQKAVLSWNVSGNAGIGTLAPSDMLDVSGSVRLLNNSNPVRLTSAWTAFPDLTANQAEICNDTTNYKALMIVGNKSAGQGRKVAVWDRLDVNGKLLVYGNMQLSQSVMLSPGTGSNGVVFPADPGGGSSDSAWIKYYPRKGTSYTLEIGTSNDGDDNIALLPSGKTGVGTYTPADNLDVSGTARVTSGTNPLRFTSGWSGFTELSSRNSEISNDTSGYKTLMIVGNRSGGQSRKVSVYDNLDVNGSLVVTGNMQARGAIVPGVGNCDVKGIMWKKDPYGGSGDAGWIRYYSDTLRGGGENMTLEIGISNDTNLETVTERIWISTCPWNLPNGCGYWRNTTTTVHGTKGDRLRLYASGGTYVDGNFYITSSAEYKENISELKQTTAKTTLDGLEPVAFNFKGDYGKETMGFIAEDVPGILSANDGKAISPMEIITVLISEVKDQEKMLAVLKKKVAALKAK